jgi:hypothetical protein
MLQISIKFVASPELISRQKHDEAKTIVLFTQPLFTNRCTGAEKDHC